MRTGPNAPLGCPSPNVAHDTVSTIPLGTIIDGYDEDNDVGCRLQWVLTGADHTVGEDVDISSSFVTSDATADTGAADAIVASTSGEYVWVQLKQPQPLS